MYFKGDFPHCIIVLTDKNEARFSAIVKALVISVYYNCWPHTTEDGIAGCYWVLREVLMKREKAIKNLLKQIFLPRGKSLLITKQIGRDDTWLYISLFFSSFFLSSSCSFWKGQLKDSMPTVPISIAGAMGCRWPRGCQSRWSTDPFTSESRQQFLKATSLNCRLSRLACI